jgi:tRNA pseudouridine55 synthase
MAVKRDISGILLLDKRIGISSNRALQEIKRLFCAKKAGHTGSLDPLATGMLPICFGSATKFSEYLLTADKVYLVSAKLGVKTTTGDAEGEIVAEKAIPELSLDQIDQYCESFRGEIEQIPSMYSALKYQGRPLYEYARKGITIDRPARKIRIYDLSLLTLNEDELVLKVSCSKGTYIRTLVEDLGDVIGCGAHVSALRRLSVGKFATDKMVDLQQLQTIAEKGLVGLDQCVLKKEVAVGHLPIIRVDNREFFFLQNGKAILFKGDAQPGNVRVVNAEDKLIAVAAVLEDGKLQAKRILSQVY